MSGIKVEYQNEHSIITSSSLFKGFDVIPLAASEEESLVASIDRLLFSDERIYVMDEACRRLLAFDKKGNFISSTEKYTGEGPEQYLSIKDAAISLNRRRIYLCCDAPYCIMEFDYDLNLVNKTNFDYYFTEIAADNNCLYGLCTSYADSPKHEILCLNLENLSESPDTILSNNGIVKGLRGFGKSLSSQGGDVRASLPFDNNIYWINDGKIQTSISLDFGEKGIDFSSVKYISYDKFLKKEGDKDWIIQNVCGNDSLILFNTNKPYCYLLNLKSTKCDVYSEMLNDVLPFTNSQLIPCHNSPNAVVYETEPVLFHNYIELAKRKSDEIKESCLEVAKKYNEDGNPIIILWYL